CSHFSLPVLPGVSHSVLGSQCYLTLDLSFQSMMKEVCSSCLQPVSSMECVAANKVLLHHSCFCCKLCKRKLSLHNYTALHGAFYCEVHYQQLAKARGGSKKEKIEFPGGVAEQAHPALNPQYQLLRHLSCRSGWACHCNPGHRVAAPLRFGPAPRWWGHRPTFE
uniref:LIM zinc-binding domain-containing protein n=1 Tax=Chrysemys picta bellii TaxID=8478 RepID=A0A8C3HZX0_CHRPI